MWRADHPVVGQYRPYPREQNCVLPDVSSQFPPVEEAEGAYFQPHERSPRRITLFVIAFAPTVASSRAPREKSTEGEEQRTRPRRPLVRGEVASQKIVTSLIFCPIEIVGK